MRARTRPNPTRIKFPSSRITRRAVTSITLARTARVIDRPPRARSAIPRLVSHRDAFARRIDVMTYRDEAHRFATRGVFVFTRRAHRDARALSASRARGDDGRRDDGRRENAGHHHHREDVEAGSAGEGTSRGAMGVEMGLFHESRLVDRRVSFSAVGRVFFIPSSIFCIASSSSEMLQYTTHDVLARDRIARSRRDPFESHRSALGLRTGSRLVVQGQGTTQVESRPAVERSSGRSSGRSDARATRGSGASARRAGWARSDSRVGAGRRGV